MLSTVIPDLNKLKIFANDELLKICNNSSNNICFLFYAPMGAGKTTLIREFGRILGIKENITSPTFVGMNEYHCADFSFYHYDLYQVGIRFEDLAEIFQSELRNILVIEWAEKLEQSHYDYLKRNSQIIKVNIEVNPDDSRNISLEIF